MVKTLCVFREEQEILDQLDGIAERRGTTRAAVIREAIRFYLRSQDHELHKERCRDKS